MKLILNWFKNNPNIIKYTVWILNAATGLILILWVITPILKDYSVEFYVEIEAVVALIAFVSVPLNYVLKKLLDEAEYSPSYALATGYINNFIFPAMTQLIEEKRTDPKICIYRPNHFDELEPGNIDMIKAILVSRNYTLSKINLKLKHGRARDILTIYKDDASQIYFDIPNTLLSLFAYVDYKVKSSENNSGDERKNKLISELIEKFYLKVDKLLEHKGIKRYVEYCDKDLDVFKVATP